jgi:tetratricopeptide (TPR) repeat protein
MRRIVFALIVMCQPAWADSRNDCFNGTTQRSATACTSVIEDPNTGDLDRSMALVLRGRSLSLAGKYPEAMKDFDEALKLDPNSSMGLNNRAWALYRWKNTADGMADANRSLELDGTSSATWDTRAHLNQLLGNIDGAFADYEVAIGFGGEPLIRTYQCGLRKEGLYRGLVDGKYSAAMRKALRTCASSKTCDPLPENELQEECDAVTS